MKTIRKTLAVFLMGALFLAGCSAKKEDAGQADEQKETAALSLPISAFGKPSGDLGELKLTETKEMSEEEKAEADRAMRAYSPSSNTPLVNNAKNFYYYSQLDDTAKDIYDALLLLAEDPVDPQNVILYSSKMDVNSEEFVNELRLAYFSMLYDHPELFWMYNEINASLMFGVPKEQSTSGYYDIYFYFDKPYDNFREDVETFNKAAEDFLKDLDPNASDEEKARWIHDKLINTVTYDMDVLNQDLYSDLAHTAYGALVKNSRGSANTAVCDGYSLAYEYLLQQAGLDAAVVLGVAGGDESDAGRHAWSIIMINGKWYEVDSTWDDFGTLETQLEEYKEDEAYPYYMEALSDPEYRDSIEHYLYKVNTQTMTNYDPGNNYQYYTKDGKYILTLVGPGIHIRASEDKEWVPINELIGMTPTAD
ncbi:MAG: hypothetical protein IKG15_08560 [Solobacterium sp.]|nr:hypothetical protein [Solobacterium sp.]